MQSRVAQYLYESLASGNPSDDRWFEEAVNVDSDGRLDMVIWNAARDVLDIVKQKGVPGLGKTDSLELRAKVRYMIGDRQIKWLAERLYQSIKAGSPMATTWWTDVGVLLTKANLDLDVLMWLALQRMVDLASGEGKVDISAA